MEHMTIRDRRTLWSQNRTKRNAENKTLSECQHRALSLIAYFRHSFHCDMGCLFFPESGAYRKYSNFFNITVPTMLRVAGLPQLNLSEIHLPESFASIEESEMFGEQINQVIENYLAGIDFLYGTWYAPSGYARECVGLASV